MNPTPEMPESPLRWELNVAIEAARSAAAIINRFYADHSASTYTKGDGSPVTDADIAADTAIREVISTAFPDDGFLTEEGEHAPERREQRRIWVVDPIDGTAEFIAGTGRFDVLIALAIDGTPVVAVTVQPATGLMHAAVDGHGAWVVNGDELQPFRIAAEPAPPRIASSKWYGGNAGRETILAVAREVGADEPPILPLNVQPRAFDPSQRTYDVFLGLRIPDVESLAKEWDIAATDLIVTEAGGRFTDLWGRRHRYNKRHTHIVGGVVTSASPELHVRVLEALSPHLPAEAPEVDGEPTR
jgi:myo-inositol-1(or 4)-monophosphatase